MSVLGFGSPDKHTIVQVLDPILAPTNCSDNDPGNYLHQGHKRETSHDGAKNSMGYLLH